MDIRIEQSRPHDFRYFVRVRIDGTVRRAWLSRDPIAKDDARSLIRVTVAPDEVPAQYRNSFVEFVRRIESLDPTRAMSAAKQAVVKIATRQWSDDRYRIAVHKMGPVPVFVPLEGQIYVESVRAFGSIALYPRSLSLSEGPVRGPVVAEQLFASLVHTNAYSVLMTYFDDIFEHFRDISDKLGILDSMNRVQLVREVISQSVVEKLAILTPSCDAWKTYQSNKRTRKDASPENPPRGDVEERAVCAWFADHYVPIGEAIFLWCIARTCVMMFFDVLGIDLRGGLDPSERFGAAAELRDVEYPSVSKCIAVFCKRYDIDQDVFDDSEVVASAGHVFEIFERGEIEELRTADASGRMVTNLREFLLFIKIARRELQSIYGDQRSIHREAIIFISRRLESQFGIEVTNVLRSSVEDVFADGTRVTTFQGDGGEPLRPSIKAQISLGDAVWSVMPEHDKAAGQDLTWLYLEAEHAYLLSKPSTTVARNPTDFSHARRPMALVEDPPLAEQLTCSREVLRTGTLERLFDNVAIIQENNDELSVHIRANLQKLKRSAARSRRIALLIGYLRMFTANDIGVFDLINRAFRRESGFRVVSITKGKFKEKSIGTDFTERDFVNAHKHADKLRVQVGHEALSILPHKRNGHYVFNLDRIAQAITGDANISEDILAEDVAAALSAVPIGGHHGAGVVER